jgi:DNA-binding NarL/FixJ family response regulator
LRERARRLGGELFLDSAPGRGSNVTLRVPYRPPQDAGTLKDPRIRVLLVDDHVVVRQGVRRMLEAEADIEVVAEAGDGEEALAKAQTLIPDVVVADVRMPGMNGVELAERLLGMNSSSRVVIFTAHADGELITRAMKAGARGYLLKDAASTELAQAVRAVQRGETYLQAVVAGELARRIRESEDGELTERLTAREKDVLRTVVQGLRNKEIARALGITEATVKFHVAHIFEKLGVSSRAEAVVRALTLGITGSEEDVAERMQVSSALSRPQGMSISPRNWTGNKGGGGR